MTKDNVGNRFTKIELENLAIVKRLYNEAWNDQRVDRVEPVPEEKWE